MPVEHHGDLETTNLLCCFDGKTAKGEQVLSISWLNGQFQGSKVCAGESRRNTIWHSDMGTMARGQVGQRPAWGTIAKAHHVQISSGKEAFTKREGNMPDFAFKMHGFPLTKGTLFYSFLHPPEILASKHMHVSIVHIHKGSVNDLMGKQMNESTRNLNLGCIEIVTS